MPNAPLYIADELTPDVYVMYRLYRFGNAGRCGDGGVAKAGKHHGVGPRAWFLYEQGKRAPKLAERQKIARWLNAQARYSVKAEEPEEVPPAPEPTTA